MPGKEKFVKVCPKCGSTRIEMFSLGRFGVYERCVECKTMLFATPEFPVAKVKQVQEKIRKKKVGKK